MTAAAFESIPVVDVSELANGAGPSPELAEELCRVGHEVGFVLVVDHGVSDDLHDAVYDLMRCFFSLPADHKALIDKRTSRHFRGWEPVGTEYTNNRPDIREQIDCWTEWPALTRDAEPEYLACSAQQWLPRHSAGTSCSSNELSGSWHPAGTCFAALWQGLGLSPRASRALLGTPTMSLTKFIHYRRRRRARPG